jgi:glycosyltransferase involved in cell wall biosynthesis
MRILSVCALMDAETGGGNAERVLQLSKAFELAGATATVLTLDIGLTTARRAAFGAVRIVALQCLQRRFLVPAFSQRVIECLVANTDVIHLTNHWTMLNAMAARAATAMGKPYVVCPAGALPVFGRSKILKAGYNTIVGRRVVGGANGWVAVTAAERLQFMMNDFADAHDAPDIRARFGIGDEVVILFVGRLNPIKGPDLLLEAFAGVQKKARNICLLIAGPDEGMRGSLVRRAADLGLSGRVHFAGYLGGRDKLAAYLAADIVAVPSRSEAMSLVALEAGACSRPVVLTENCGFDEAATAGGGIVVPANPDGIGGGLARLAGNAGLRTVMGARLRQLVESRYTWPNSAKQYLELFVRVRNWRH